VLENKNAHGEGSCLIRYCTLNSIAPQVVDKAAAEASLELSIWSVSRCAALATN
jgi:hypothetical protein